MTKSPHLLRDWTLVQDVVELAAVVDRASGATTIGIDVEANGLFVYRPRLCTVQLAWEEGERTSIAVIDTLRVDIAALAPLFSATAPIKVLHQRCGSTLRRWRRFSARRRPSRCCTTSRSTRACCTSTVRRYRTCATRRSRRGCSG